ncbi:hypothetical protein Tco_1085591 [Tanacetum coccineum]
MAKIQKVPNADSGTDSEPLEQVQYDTENDVFANEIQHFEQSESISNTCVVETDDSNVIPNSPDMCDNDIQNDQNDVECDDERVALANLIANLKLDVDENKKIQKQLNKANATLTQELTECKSVLTETSRTLGESNSIQDSCLVALQNKQTELEEYMAFNNRTVDYEKLEHKLNETLGLLAQKDIDIKEGLKVKAYEISVVQAKHDELVKQSLLTKSHYEGLVKEKTKIPHDQSGPANRLIPDKEEILTLEEESRSKLNKDLVKPYDYTMENSLYENFKPSTLEYQIQLAHANEIRKKMWRKSFVKTKPNIFKNIEFLPVSKSISKSRQAYNVMTNNISHLKDIVNQAWVKHSNDHINLRPLTAQDMQIFIKTCLMPLALKTQNVSFACVHELKQEMHADLKYVESLEDEINELESDKAEFSNMYDMLLEECVSNDVMCSYLHSLSDLDAYNELQCLYLHKVKECDCLTQKLLKQTEFEREQYFEIQDLKAQLQDKNIAIRVAHRTNVSKPQPRSNQMKDKVVPNTSHVKFKKTEVEEHPKISSISNETKSVTMCNDSLNSKTLNVHDVCVTCGKCEFNFNHDACVTMFFNVVNARTKKPKVVPISTRKPKSQANKSVATYRKKIVAS